MTIQHHTDDELLLALAAGRLPSAQALVVATHLERCTPCRGRLHTLQALGGEFLDAAEPQWLAPHALARTLERIDAPEPRAAARPAGPAPERPELPAGLRWPDSLRACAVSRWRWMAPGTHWSRVRLPFDAPGMLYLLRIAPGRRLVRHSHSDLELTQVLCGSFDDGRQVFGPGDFDAADSSVRHEPVARPGGDCVCLTYVDGRLEFDGWIAAAAARLMGA